MHPTAKQFKQKANEELGFEVQVTEFPEGTKTAKDAADAIGCDVSQIVKSIVMTADDEVVIVLTSGDNRVSEEKLAEKLGVGETRTANPDEVKDATGWSIGGVPPFCHEKEKRVFVDGELLDFDEVWAAAGTPEAVFPISPENLLKYSGAEEVDIFE